jgi:hypothetical protein
LQILLFQHLNSFTFLSVDAQIRIKLFT